MASGRVGSGVPVNSNMIRQWCVSTMCFVHPKKRNEGEERGDAGETCSGCLVLDQVFWGGVGGWGRGARSACPALSPEKHINLHRPNT